MYFQQLEVLLKSLCKDKSVFAMILLSAFLVTGVRLATPFRVGKDQAIQLEASQRLVRGLGLTTTKAYPRESNDILIAPSSKYLTHWPPGFSVLVASFLYAGLSLPIALKLLYAPISVIGWIGWGTIASNFFVRPVTYGKAASSTHLIIVALLPLVATPKWEGTDIFLWAGIPIIFLCLLGVNKNKPSLLTIAGAGFLFGCLVAIRFTSLFISLAALLILFQVSYPHITVFLKRYIVFLFSASTIMLPTMIYLKLYGERVTSAGHVVDIPYVFDYGYLIKGILKSLFVTSTLVVGHPLVEMVVYRLNRDWFTYVAGLISLTVVLAWPLFLWRGARSKIVKAKDDLALNLSFLPVSLVFFLIVAAIYVRTPQFVQVRRYYEVLSLCGIFIFYEIATRRAALRIAKIASKAVLLTFILYGCVIVPALAYTNNRQNSVDSNARGFTKSGMFKVYTPTENSRIKVEQLYRDNPDALFYAHYYQWFTYDRFDRLPTPGVSMRAIPKPDFWKHAYTSKPVKVFWILDEKATLDFIPDFNQRLVFLDRDEEMKILVSDFSSGPLVSQQIARKTE